MIWSILYWNNRGRDNSPHTKPNHSMSDGNASAWSIGCIEEEVQRLACKISFKYVPNPSMNGVKRDTPIGLKRFHHSIRNRARFVDNKNSTTHNNDEDNSTNNPAKYDGLGTNLRPTSSFGPGDNLLVAREVEAFIYDIEKDILGRIDNTRRQTQGKSITKPRESITLSAN